MADDPKACPACGGGRVIRSGHACGRRRWRREGCGRRFTRTTPRGKPAAMTDEAVALYRTGLSLDAIGKRLGVSARSVMRRVRDLGHCESNAPARDRCPKPEPTGDTAVVELDEVWHFGRKKPASSESGKAFERDGGRRIDRECGGRDAGTLVLQPGFI